MCHKRAMWTNRLCEVDLIGYKMTAIVAASVPVVMVRNVMQQGNKCFTEFFQGTETILHSYVTDKQFLKC